MEREREMKTINIEEMEEEIMEIRGEIKGKLTDEEKEQRGVKRK